METVITLLDEINCKLDGLDTSTKKYLGSKFNYEVPNARFTPAVKLGRWKGKKSFFSPTGQTNINLLPEIIDYLDSLHYTITINDQRKFTGSFELENISEDSYSKFVWQEGHPSAGEPIMVRDYQVEAINNFLNDTQCVQVLPTGAGKSLVTGILSHKIESYGRSILIVPNKNLVLQTETDYKNLGLDVGVYYGNRKDIDKTHTICTWQSLHALVESTKKGKNEEILEALMRNLVCIIADEVHVASATVLQSLLSTTFKDIPIRWGVTGTMPKNDYQSVAIKTTIGNVVSQLAAKELQDKGVLANCHVNIVQTMDAVEFKSYADELAHLSSDPERIAYLASLYKEIAKSGNTLILVGRKAAGYQLEQLIPGSIFLSGEDDVKTRKKEFANIQSSQNEILICTYGIAAVGINIISLYNVVLMESGKSFVRTIQSIGRGLRRGFGKESVDIWDITSSCKFSKRHLTQRKSFYNEYEYPYSIEKVDYRKK